RFDTGVLNRVWTSDITYLGTCLDSWGRRNALMEKRSWRCLIDWWVGWACGGIRLASGTVLSVAGSWGHDSGGGGGGGGLAGFWVPLAASGWGGRPTPEAPVLHGRGEGRVLPVASHSGQRLCGGSRTRLCAGDLLQVGTSGGDLHRQGRQR